MKKSVVIALLVVMNAGRLVAQGQEAETLPAKYQGPAKPLTPEGQFFSAIAKGDIKTAESLVAGGISANIQDALGNTPLHYAQDLKIVKFLVDHGANVNAQNDDGIAPLHVHVVRGHPKIVNYLLGHKADANIKNKEKMTPLHLATMIAFWGDKKGLLVLTGIGGFVVAGNIMAEIGYMASPSKGWKASGFLARGQMRNRAAGETLGYPAVRAGAIAVTAAIIAAVDIAVRNSILNNLLAHGAQVDAQDADGNTPLHTLASGPIVKARKKLRRGGLIMAKKILDQGADQGINLRVIKNNDGLIPYDVAKKNDRLLLARFLNPDSAHPLEEFRKYLRELRRSSEKTKATEPEAAE